MAKLTNKALEALRTHDKGRKLREDDGLVGMVRPRADGGVSVQWSWRYRFKDEKDKVSKVRQIACGTWPKATMPEIRKERERLAAILEAGRDPADARAVVRLQARAEQLEDKAREQARIDEAEAQKARMTVKELFDLWELRMLCQHKDKGASVRQAFNRDVFSQIGGLAIEDVKKSHINAMIETTLARGVGRTAKLVLSLVRQMFRYAVEKDFIEADPTMAIRKAKIAKDSERERVLSEAEVTALYKALPGAKMANPRLTSIKKSQLDSASWRVLVFESSNCS